MWLVLDLEGGMVKQAPRGGEAGEITGGGVDFEQEYTSLGILETG